MLRRMNEDFPEALQIEVTNKCNFNCQMCIRHVWDAKPIDLNLDLYKNIAKSTFPYLRRLILYGLGESFINPNFLEMLKIAREYLPKESEIIISTNGSLLNHQLIGKILKIGIDNISFSIDTLDFTKLKYIRKGVKPIILLKNFQYMVKMKKFGKRAFKIGVEVTIMKDNFMDLPNLVEKVSQEGIDYIFVSHIVPYTEEMFKKTTYITLSEKPLEIIKPSLNYGELLIYESIIEAFGETYGTNIVPKASKIIKEFWNEAEKNGYWINLPLLFSLKDKIVILKDIEEIFKVSKKIAYEYGVDIKLPNIYPNAKERVCPYVNKNTVFIRSDGVITPCSEFAYSHPIYINMHLKNIYAIIFGDLKKESIKEIWNKEIYVNFREIRRKIAENVPWCGDCVYSTLGCFFTKNSNLDCYTNRFGCNECLYSVNLAQCNI